MTNKRVQIYYKYGGRCAYCGREIEFKDMQVDHIFPQHMCIGIHTSKLKNIDNLNPSCRRCNHYKRGESLEYF
jgi:5-methylcytosine-specific restriction endonuclease McrA